MLIASKYIPLQIWNTVHLINYLWNNYHNNDFFEKKNEYTKS